MSSSIASSAVGLAPPPIQCRAATYGTLVPPWAQCPAGGADTRSACALTKRQISHLYGPPNDPRRSVRCDTTSSLVRGSRVGDRELRDLVWIDAGTDLEPIP